MTSFRAKTQPVLKKTVIRSRVFFAPFHFKSNGQIDSLPLPLLLLQLLLLPLPLPLLPLLCPQLAPLNVVPRLHQQHEPLQCWQLLQYDCSREGLGAGCLCTELLPGAKERT
mgnify:CR=1 FL=1